MTTYPGLPGPLISDHLSREASRAVYAPGTEFQIGRIDMVANTGTYLDTPSHRYPAGFDLADLPLERVVNVPGVCVQAPGRRSAPSCSTGSTYRDVPSCSPPAGIATGAPIGTARPSIRS